MADITVTKKNEVYLKIFCPEHIAQEISEFFTFYSPNYQWSPAYKERRSDGSRKWDGKTRLFSKLACELPAGLFRYLMKFADQRKYTIECEPGISLLNNFSLEEAKDFITGLDIWSKTSPLPPRDYQIVGVAKSIRYKRILLVSPTASGKSYMMYAICRYLLNNGCKKGLIIVPTISLVEQLKSDFEDYSHNTWDVDANVHKIYEGQEKKTGKAITISTWQSIYEQKSKGFFEEFDFVIGDEAHTFHATSLKTIMTKLVNAKYRIATTGTLDKWKVHKLTIEGFFGPVSKITTTKRMMDEKQIAQLQIKALILKHPQEICLALSNIKNESYQKEIEYLISSNPRNAFIRNLTLSLRGNTLLLFQFVEAHGEKLYTSIIEKVSKNRKVFFVHGETEVMDREVVRAIVEKETDAIIIASYGVFSTGINIKNLHNIILASPSKSKIRVLQSIGRGLRLGDNKTHMTLYDISDDLRVNDFVNYTLKHFAERVRIYKQEEFKISNYNVDLK